MKRKLFSLLVLLMAAVTGAWADKTVTFSYDDYKNQGTQNTGSEYTMIKDDVSIKESKFYCSSSYANAQFYANGVTTVMPEEGVTIKQIVITASTTSYNGYQNSGTIIASTGEIGHEGTIITWTGSATAAFTLSHNKQIRWTTITVTYEKNSEGGNDQPASDGVDYNLTVGENAHGTITFKVGDETVTKAKQNDVVTMTITPNTGWVVNQPSGQWYAAMAKSPQRRTSGSSIDLLTDITLTPVEGQTNTWTFTMGRANAEISVSYKKLLTNTDITISNILPVTYNAQAHTPSITVKDGDKVLVLGTDYTVTYSDNVMACDKDAAENAPTVTIKAVEGHNFYVGENSKTFTIRKKTLEDGFMSKVADLTYNGKAQEPAPTLTYDGITLVEGKDYVFSYINNKDVASTTDAKAPVVTASAVKNSNFTGAATQKFNIKKAPLTIKAADVNIIHGSEVPQYEVSYEGFVAQETVAVLEGTLAVTCSYTKESAVGSTYDITPSGLTAKNYDITFVPGKLTVLVDQAAVDQAAADNAMGKITAIGEVAYTEASKTLIDAAREAYDALTDAQKALVTNLETLTTAETTYSNLKAAAEKAAADKLAADAVIGKITAIGEVAYTPESKGLIEAAREAYTALTEEQKALVTNLEVLTTAETTYANLKAAAEKAAADQAAAGDVIDKIVAIGEVVYTEDCKALIEAARNAYNALTADQKALVTNLEVLTVAEKTYEELAQIATGISTIKAIAGKTIYDMNGRKVTVPSKKGLYIINGKKVVIK